MRYTLTWTIKSVPLNSSLNSKPQFKTMARKATQKTLYKEGTMENKIQTLQTLGGHLFAEKKDCHQVFMWYAGTLGHFGMRVSNKVKVTAPTIQECVDDMEAAMLLEAEAQAKEGFSTVQDAIYFFESFGDERKRILKEVDKKKTEIEELFSKLENLGVHLNLKQ